MLRASSASGLIEHRTHRSGAASGNVISLAQPWVENFGTGATVVATLGSNPQPGDLLVVVGIVLSNVKTLAISDSIGDGVAWNSAPFNPFVGAASTSYSFWKQVGTTVTGNTVTLTPSSSGTEVECQVGAFRKTGGAWTKEGTWPILNLTSANPDPGPVNPTSGLPTLVVGFVAMGTNTPAAGNGYTLGILASHTIKYASEYLIVPYANWQYDPNWTAASINWGAAAMAWSAR